MVNAAKGRSRLLAVCVAAILVVTAIAAPAYAFFYVHGNDYGVNENTNGAMEILCTLDGSANGEAPVTSLIFIPANGTPAQCLDQMVKSSNSQQGQEAIHSYDYASISEYVADGVEKGTWKCTVYHAESQAPGTQATHDGAGETVTDLDSFVLQRYDNVEFTAL